MTIRIFHKTSDSGFPEEPRGDYSEEKRVGRRKTTLQGKQQRVKVHVGGQAHRHLRQGAAMEGGSPGTVHSRAGKEGENEHEDTKTGHRPPNQQRGVKRKRAEIWSRQCPRKASAGGRCWPRGPSPPTLLPEPSSCSQGRPREQHSQHRRSPENALPWRRDQKPSPCS